MKNTVNKAILVLALGLVGSVAAAQSTKGLNVEVIEYGSNNRSKIIELEAAKQKIQDTVSLYKKGMSNAHKDQLTKDLKALRKCKFQQPCVDEAGNKVGL